MQKKLIALAVAGVIAAPLAAQAAGVEVYGKAIVSVEATDNDATNGDAMVLSTNQSRIAFKGTEELGGGLTFVWQWENYVNFDTGGWGGMAVKDGEDVDDAELKVKSRNTYVGFTGGFGTALAGRHDTPYKLAVSSLDPFKDLVGDFNSVMGVSQNKFKHADRLGNVLAYVSPDMGGFQFLGAYMLDETRDTVSDDAYSFAGIYKIGSLKVSAGYQVANELGNEDVSGNLGNDTAMELGLGYKVGKTSLSFIYESTDSDTNSSGKETDRNTLFFGIKHKINKTTLALSYTAVDAYGDSVDTGATQISAGIYHKLSKKTKVYAIYTAIDNEEKAKFDLFNKTGVATYGNDPSSFGIGVISEFSTM